MASRENIPIPVEVSRHLQPPPPPLDPAAIPSVIDPTTYGHRRRRSSHARLYSLARLAIVLSLAASSLAILCIALGDERIARPAMHAALVSGILATFLAARGLASRVLGYAVAATLLAAVALAAAALLPETWPDPRPQHAPIHPDPPAPTAPST